jgi:hypothetical protein
MRMRRHVLDRGPILCGAPEGEGDALEVIGADIAGSIGCLPVEGLIVRPRPAKPQSDAAISGNGRILDLDTVVTHTHLRRRRKLQSPNEAR